jgi:Type I phosphodiesterase / nucleotide pyrophosphatase
MATTSNSRIIYLDTLLDLDQIEHFDCWPLKGLRPIIAENTTSMYEHLKSLSVDQPWNVYARDLDMPPQWHFHASYRIAPIYMVPDPGWVLVNNLREFDPEEDGEYQPKGIHGYDNDHELMRSLFLARGPAFQYSYPVAPFNNTEVYGIMTSILGITGNPNNGTFVKGRLPRLEVSEEVAVIPSSTEIGNTGIVPPYVSSAIMAAKSSAYDIPTAATATAIATTAASTSAATASVLPDMTEADWEQVEEDIAKASEEGRPLTWKEYLELKAEAMREELDEWWDWMKHGGSDSAK